MIRSNLFPLAYENGISLPKIKEILTKPSETSSLTTLVNSVATPKILTLRASHKTHPKQRTVIDSSPTAVQVALLMKKNVTPSEYVFLKNRYRAELFLTKIDNLSPEDIQALALILKENNTLEHTDFESTKKALRDICHNVINGSESFNDLITTHFLAYLSHQEVKESILGADFLCVFFKLYKSLFPLENFRTSKCDSLKNQIEDLKSWLSEDKNFHTATSLDLSNTRVTSIPSDILACLKNVAVLKCNNLHSMKLLQNITQLNSLKELELQENNLQSLPSDFFNTLPLLEKLDLSSNLFNSIEVKKLKKSCKQKHIQLTI